VYPKNFKTKKVWTLPFFSFRMCSVRRAVDGGNFQPIGEYLSTAKNRKMSLRIVTRLSFISNQRKETWGNFFKSSPSAPLMWHQMFQNSHRRYNFLDKLFTHRYVKKLDFSVNLPAGKQNSNSKKSRRI
jgi:hypothetical protein